MIQARRDAGNTTLVEYDLRHPRQWEISLEVAGAGVHGLDTSSNAAELNQYEIVLVTETVPPTPEWGQHRVLDPAGEKIGPDWFEKWDLLDNGDLAALKAQGQTELQTIIETKMDSLVEQKGVSRVLLRLLLFVDESRFQVDASADPLVHPMLNAYKTETGLSGGAALAALETMRLNWMTRGGELLIGEKVASDAIDVAVDRAEIQAALEVAEAL